MAPFHSFAHTVRTVNMLVRDKRCKPTMEDTTCSFALIPFDPCDAVQAHPPSPPAYLSRPWTTKRMPRSDTELPPTSPVAHPPSPLARRRRRFAGGQGVPEDFYNGCLNVWEGLQFQQVKDRRDFGPSEHKQGTYRRNAAKLSCLQVTMTQAPAAV